MDFVTDSIELLRITFLLGAVLALICKKKFGITPGGIIVPGLLACILLTSFYAFLFTIFTSVICWVIYKLLFSSYAVSTRWSSLIIIAMSLILGTAELALLQKMDIGNIDIQTLSIIIPGLFTISAKRYGFSPALQSTLTVTLLTYLGGAFLATILPSALTSYLGVRLGGFDVLTLPNPLISPLISVGASVLIYFWFSIRSGGYMIAPFLVALLAVSPVQFALVLTGVLLSYLTIKMIQKYTLIIGLERFVMSLFCGYFVVSMLDFVAITIGIPNYQTAPLILIIAIAVITNDLSLLPLRKYLSKGLGPALLTSYLARVVI